MKLNKGPNDLISLSKLEFIMRQANETAHTLAKAVTSSMTLMIFQHVLRI